MSSASPQPKKSRLKYIVLGGLLILLCLGSGIYAKRKNAD